MQVGSLIRFRNTGVLGIVIKRTKDLDMERWRVLGIKNLRWYNVNTDNQYIEVICK